MSEQERQLILLCQNGQLENFTALYDHYIQPIYKFIYHKTNHQAITEDLVSTVFLKALNGLKKFDVNQGYFSAWLYKIAKNTVADYYRFRRETKSLDEIWDLSADINLEDDLDKTNKLDQIRQALTKLKPEQREIVILRVWQELSYQEIAAIIGKSEANCKMTFSRAIKNLSQKISLALFISLLIII